MARISAAVRVQACTAVLQDHKAAVTSVAFSKDDQHLASSRCRAASSHVRLVYTVPRDCINFVFTIAQNPSVTEQIYIYIYFGISSAAGESDSTR